MSHSLPQTGIVDPSFMGYEAVLQVAGCHKNLVLFHTKTINMQIKRGLTLNLLYDFTRSVLIHFFPKTSKSTRKTAEDLQRLTELNVSG